MINYLDTKINKNMSFYRSKLINNTIITILILLIIIYMIYRLNCGNNQKIIFIENL